MTLKSPSKRLALCPFYTRVLRACADQPMALGVLADRLGAPKHRVRQAMHTLKARRLALLSRYGVCRATPSGRAYLSTVVM